MANIKFTKEEAAYIDKKLGSIIFDWAKSLVNHILVQARDKGVEVVYMNTPETLDAGAITEGKTSYFYDRLPPLLGFQREQANLRGRGKETLWAYRFKEIESCIKNAIIKIAKTFALQEMPKKYQGAFIGLLGRKEFYTDAEVKQVLDVIEKREKKPKSTSKYYYDWSSRTWSGSQTFKDNSTENVVLQKITSEVQNMMTSDPILRKFWAYILSHPQHFGADVLGFALISKISPKIWVINEIQTDCINHYMDLRKEALQWGEKENKSEGISWDSLKDMLIANNRSKWVSKCEMNEAFKQQLMKNPNLLDELPDDSQDIDKWVSEQQRIMAEQGATMGMDLITHFQSVNFNSRIFKLY